MSTPRIATVQHPLTRRARGPGLIIVTETSLDSPQQGGILDPPPVQKWAEEGYAVAHVVVGADSNEASLDASLSDAANQVLQLETCGDRTKLGVIAYLSPSNPSVSALLKQRPEVAGAVFFNFCPQYTGSPILAHVPGKPTEPPTTASAEVKQYFYPAASPFFVMPGHENYNPSSASLAHTRTLSFLKPLLAGPYFDIEAIWEEHTLYEFGERDVEKTMATMVEQPYVNHIPTLTGGIGRGPLTAFYRDHFIFNNPADTELELVSRTVGIDRVIDEFVLKCTHDKVIDCLLPGVPPTGKPLSIPFTSVVNVRGDRLHHEHISWDQATALRQLGLLPEYLPFPYAIDGKTPADGKRFEYRLPVGGEETARKLMDERAVESNGMFGHATREVQKSE